ncbi:MAG: hypothetical protein JW849_06975 [Phycisphaerae bacterium]|nr:hypothetical protein [Phycisphaerae bacterium]
MDAQTLTLEKDGHLYLFRYTSGSEDALIEELMHLADDRSVNFDWLDAATMSFQVAQVAGESLGELEPDELAMD